jgi:hypothetical protein
MKGYSSKTYVPLPLAGPDGPVTVFAQGDPPTHLKVDVHYSKGGMSYFSGNTHPRGYYVSFTPVKLDTSPGGFASESFMMFSGKGYFVAPAKAANAKKFAAIVAALTPKAADFALLYATNKTQLHAALADALQTAAVAV